MKARGPAGRLLVSEEVSWLAERKTMDIEEYSRNHVQFYTGEIPAMLEDRLKTTVFKSIVDLGCGDGALLHALKMEGHLEGREVHAVDVSEQRIETVGKLDGDFQLHVCDACELDCLEDRSVDFLVSSQVIEHVSSDRDMVREIARVLKDGGTAYLSTVYKKWYGWYFYRCGGRWVLDPTHLREYTDDSQLLPLIEEDGLEVVEERKRLISFPLLDFFIRRIRLGRDMYERRWLSLARRLRIPIPGYYYWEIICLKETTG